MRSKEDAHDYRYFPDPDLPPLVIAPEWVERVKAVDAGAAGRDARTLRDGVRAVAVRRATADRVVGRRGLFRSGRRAARAAACEAGGQLDQRRTRRPRLNADGRSIDASPIDAATLGALVGRIVDGTISNAGAKIVFEALWDASRDADGAPSAADAPPRHDVDAIIAAKQLRQISDSGALEATIDDILAKSPSQLADYRAGKEKLFGYFVGQAMKATGGKANPQQLNEVLRRKLAETA